MKIVPSSINAFAYLKETLMEINVSSLKSIRAAWRHHIQSLALLALLAPYLVATSLAQIGGKGAIEGTVKDPSGAVVPGATVTAREVDTGVSTVRTATNSGYFVISPLDPGKYTVTVTEQGFQQFNQENITLDAIQTIGLQVTLKVGETTQSVTISAAPPPLGTENATLGTTIEQSTYAALPDVMTAGKRDPTAFVFLSPGVTNTAGFGVFDGSGSRGGDNEVYVEGIAIDKTKAQGDTGNLSSVSSVDSLEQFQVLTSSYPVEYQGQGVENYVVKSGTNQIHGSIFEYFRNTALDTWNFFSKAVINPATGTATKPVEHMDEYGLTIGGPIIKDKLFLFASFDGDHYLAHPNPGSYTVPTIAARGGDFTAYGINIYDPTTTTCSGGICHRTQFMGMKNGFATANVIPAGEISSISQGLQANLPAPTNTTALSNNYIIGQPINTAAWSTTNKLDYTLNAKHSFSIMVGAGRSYNVSPSFSGFQAPLPYGSATVNTPFTKTIILAHTYVYSPHLINQLKYGFARNLALTYNPTSTPGFAASSYGITGLPPGDAGGSFPLISFSGTDGPTQWAGERASLQTTNTFILLDNMQWTHGKHSVTVGAQLQWMQDNEWNNTLNESSPLQLMFAVAETQNYTSAGALASGTGLSYASFLMGAVDSSNLTDDAVLETAARFRPFSPYAQDDYKVNSKLTVNLGMRWDYYPPFYEAENRVSFFIPTLTNPLTGNPGAEQFGGFGLNSCSCRTTVKPFYKNFGPRLGLAYSVDSKTVVRAGWGVMYSHGGGTGGTNGSDQGNGTIGFTATPTITSTSGSGIPAFYLANGFPAYNHPPFLSGALNAGFTTLSNVAGGGLNYADPYYGGRSPQYINWNVGVQRLLTNSMSFSVNYVGSQSHFLRTSGDRGWQNDELNPVYFALGSALLNSTATAANVAAAAAIVPGIMLPYPTFNGTIVQMLRPFPQYTSTADTYGNLGNANYNALQLTVNQPHPQHGLVFMLNYTYSKMIDDEGNFRSGWLSNGIERSAGTAGQPQNLSGLVVYSLPFGSGALGGGNALVRNIAGGWQISGIYKYYSGSPLAITGATCSNLPDQGTCVPSFNPSFTGPARMNGPWGSGMTAKSASSSPFINNQAFIYAANYTFGNIARTEPYGLVGPGGQNLDASLRRSFNIWKKWETVKLAVQLDVFNVANKVVFSAPNQSYQGVGTSSFGTISSQANSSRDMQLNAKITW